MTTSLPIVANHGTDIEWTWMPGYVGATWNPGRGCSRVSPGCGGPNDEGGCYAEEIAARFSGPGQAFEGFAEMRNGRPRWTRRVEILPKNLGIPLRRRHATCWFVNSMSDLFHEALPSEDIAAVFGVMAAAPRHRFIILTKRAERMRQWFEWADRLNDEPSCLTRAELIRRALGVFAREKSGRIDALFQRPIDAAVWPLPNVILGVSCEDQATADERIPHLLATPAACRVVSLEPLLGPINARLFVGAGAGVRGDYMARFGEVRIRRLDWGIGGGESGRNYREMDVKWLVSLAKQFRRAGVPFFPKQDSGRFPGRQGRIPDAIAMKEYPVL